SYRIKPNLPVLGKRYGKLLPTIRKALEEADGASVAGAVARGETFEIEAGGETIQLGGEDVLIETQSAEGYACGEDAGYLTALDTSLDAALVEEGMAREIVRSVQDARKQAGLEVSDRIVLGVSGSDGIERALAKHRGYVMSETLATEWETGQAAALHTARRELGDEHWLLEFRKAG
ncbi:MAG TPA: DUF5915 domain-containing protein, partial [Woeseiaceae bacterium]|nr:DUF5915 domain-containing protein [Woeseiaceae bacterium]